MAKYFDQNDNIRKELLNEEALATARSFVEKRDGGRLDDRRSIKSSQLRRFFGEFRNLQRKIEQQDDREKAFAKVLPLVKMAKSKVVYAKSRQVVPESFVTWMTRNIDAIESSRDFDAFLLHFEAVVGFCYGEGLKD